MNEFDKVLERLFNDSKNKEFYNPYVQGGSSQIAPKLQELRDAVKRMDALSEAIKEGTPAIRKDTKKCPNCNIDKCICVDDNRPATKKLSNELTKSGRIDVLIKEYITILEKMKYPFGPSNPLEIVEVIERLVKLKTII